MDASGKSASRLVEFLLIIRPLGDSPPHQLRQLDCAPPPPRYHRLLRHGRLALSWGNLLPQITFPLFVVLTASSLYNPHPSAESIRTKSIVVLCKLFNSCAYYSFSSEAHNPELMPQQGPNL
ncbi:hypothetical protein KOW79_010131 [Hemibagrus wyckioides]|uniref:Uncharacterized protein n=1 Tax=Hemibagrus wyckioides TaxID=337641 RepID=A0A9D3NTB0_9TELE|nr:hypothetical protein KOW79_010131 [Hemibagrus wyckioides]